MPQLNQDWMSPFKGMTYTGQMSTPGGANTPQYNQFVDQRRDVNRLQRGYMDQYKDLYTGGQNPFHTRPGAAMPSMSLSQFLGQQQPYQQGLQSFADTWSNMIGQRPDMPEPGLMALLRQYRG